MTDQPNPRRARLRTAVLVVVLLLVIAAVAVAGILSSGGGRPHAGATTPVAATIAPSTPGAPSPSASAPASASPRRTPKVVKRTGAPTPQPTRTAAISEPTAVPIKKELTATVVKTEAVTGTADGPGEIGGPSVRFTIRISNTTGRPVALGNTVVNAYYGTSSTPAVPLRQPGGKDFPASVKNGGSATGVFVFNIPKAQRAHVEVTVDTAVQNPVIAFKGSAPR